MELENPSNGEPEDVGGGGEEVMRGRGSPPRRSPACYADDFDSACSTPFVSAPSSPGRGAGAVPVAVSGGYFFSAPSSPMHYILSSAAFSPSSPSYPSSFEFEFEFSARFPPSAAAAADGSMCSAEDLFLNGQIRPMKLSSHLQRPQHLAPLMDLNGEEEDEGDKCEARKEGAEPVEEVPGGRGRDLKLRSRSVRRQARSLSPLRNAPFFWRLDGGGRAERTRDGDKDPGRLKKTEAEVETETETDHTPPVSASSSRSSSTSSSSSSSSTSSSKKRWISFKDFLHRSKSEGSGKSKEKFWHAIPFAAHKERPKPPPPAATSTTSAAPVPPLPSLAPEKKPAATTSKRTTGASSSTAAPTNGSARRRRRGAAPSPHERLYTANRAQAEEMRRRTFLPYRQGLLGCLGFSSRGYFAINGLARSLHSVSSR